MTPKQVNLKGLYETIAYIVVRGSSKEVLFSYGYDHEKLKKILFTLQKTNTKLFLHNHIQSS